MLHSVIHILHSSIMSHIKKMWQSCCFNSSTWRSLTEHSPIPECHIHPFPSSYPMLSHLLRGDRWGTPWTGRQAIWGLTQRDTQPFSLTFLPCMWLVRGSWSTRRKDTQKCSSGPSNSGPRATMNVTYWSLKGNVYVVSSRTLDWIMFCSTLFTESFTKMSS